MSKKWIAVIGLCAAATVLMGLAACSHTPAGTVYASAQPQTEDATIAELRQTIAELSALISLLLGTDGTNEEGQQAGIPSISSQRAREIAVELVGYGVARDVLLFSEDGVLQFEVEVWHLNRRYMVYIDAIDGEFLSISRFDEALAPGYVMGLEPGFHQVMPTPPPVGNIVIPENIVPGPPARPGGPATPAISARRAVELARDHLISIGVTNARFDYVYMDRENGVWVWSVEFDGQGRDYDFYVDVNTGAFLKAPSGTAAPPAAVPSPSPQASPSPSPQVSPSPSPRPSPQVSPSPSPRPGTGEPGRPVNPAVTLERAIEIGYEELARRGHTGSFRNHSGMDLERGQWVWELLFNVQGGRLPFVEMYINVDTGAVVKFEWDD